MVSKRHPLMLDFTLGKRELSTGVKSGNGGSKEQLGFSQRETARQ
jgi:hypothetical protein